MLSRARARLAGEHGSVAIAVVIVTLMVALGLATFASVGTQTQLSANDRIRESAFNLAEGAMNAQTFIIGRLGPGHAAATFPTQCPQAGVQLCPDAATVSNSFDGDAQADYAAGTTWTTTVRDNGSGTFYDPAVVDTQPHYDANGDDEVWVRASATVRGETRTLVALVEVEARQIEFPRYALLSGKFKTSNNGNKTIIDTTGSLGIGVRCDEVGNPDGSSTCLGYDPNKGQVSPNVWYDNYTNASAVSADDIDGLRDYAEAQGTHYATCPSNPNGLVVFIDAGNCTYNNSAPAAAGQTKCCNSQATPGIIIVRSGTLTLDGNIEFNGLIYAVNQQASSGDVVKTLGTTLIRGGVIIDGNGGYSAGASGANLIFDPKPFDDVRSFGTASIVQNTWRELTN